MLYTKSVLLRNIEGLHMLQQKWRGWIADQGCSQFGFLKPEFETPLAFLEIKKTDKIWLFSVEKV